MSIAFPRGTEWRKWDMHVHTPESIVQGYGWYVEIAGMDVVLDIVDDIFIYLHNCISPFSKKCSPSLNFLHTCALPGFPEIAIQCHLALPGQSSLSGFPYESLFFIGLERS